FPVALEGALKLKEISYTHAEGYPAAEMKHGPIAMIDEKTPTVVVIPSGTLYEKTFSNLEEIKARNGPIIAVATEGNTKIASKVQDVIYLPQTLEHCSRCWQSSRCNCWPTTSQSPAVATWTSRATWPRA